MSETFHINADGLTSHAGHIFIGYSTICQIRIPGEAYESPYASLVRNPDGTTWRLVRMIDDMDIRINSAQLHLVHYLKDGDRIDFPDYGRELIFVQESGDRSSAAGYYSRFRRMVIGLGCCFAAVTALLLLFFGPDDIRQWEISGQKESICKITVTDIIYQEVKKVADKETAVTIDSVYLAEGTCSGTGFFDKAGRFITARHCVEPWISVSDPLSQLDRKDVAWAAEAETYNTLNDPETDGYRRVISRCVIYRGGEALLTFRTDTCLFSTDKDIVRNLRGINDELYWRELGPIKWESALGDIACVMTETKGRIRIAGKEVMDALCQNTPAAHWGYESASEQASFMNSRIKYPPFRKGGRLAGCLAHSSKGIIVGFSGSPVLVRHKGRIYAIGIVSRNNSSNSGTCHSVPACELDKLKRRW